MRERWKKEASPHDQEKRTPRKSQKPFRAGEEDGSIAMKMDLSLGCGPSTRS